MTETGKWRQAVGIGPCATPYCARCSRCVRHYGEQRNLAQYGSIDYPGNQTGAR